MQQRYGITYETSIRYKSVIENIADEIYKKKTARIYFGNSPFVSPDKEIFILKKDNGNELLLSIVEAPINASINLMINTQYANKDQDTNREIKSFVGECCNIINKNLDIDISRIGTVYEFTVSMENASQFILNNFVIDIFNGSLALNGGNYMYLYRDTPLSIGKEMNINLTITINDKNDKLLFKIDINNKNNVVGEVSEEFIDLIANYAYDFVFNKVIVWLENKGITIDE